jgi:hypothetical protein
MNQAWSLVDLCNPEGQKAIGENLEAEGKGSFKTSKYRNELWAPNY